jgi:hypothetical protein
MIGYIGQDDALSAALRARGTVVGVVPRLEAWPGELRPWAVVCGPGATGDWREALAWSARTGVALIGRSRLGTVAGRPHADIQVEEDAPLRGDARLPELQALVAAERRWHRTPAETPRVLLRLPLLLSPEQGPAGRAAAVLERAVRPGRLPRGGVHLGDARDAAALVATLAERLWRCPEQVPGVVHATGHAVDWGELRRRLHHTGHRAPARPWWSRRPRAPLPALHWGARSLHAPALGHAPRPLTQTLAELSWTP